MNAETADNVGTPQLKQFLMVSIKEFPRGINSDQAISFGTASTDDAGVRPGPGPKPQASSPKLLKKQATSFKPQAASVKLEAASVKLQVPRTTEKFHGPRTKVLNADEGVVWMPYMEGYLVW